MDGFAVQIAKRVTAPVTVYEKSGDVPVLDVLQPTKV